MTAHRTLWLRLAIAGVLLATIMATLAPIATVENGNGGVRPENMAAMLDADTQLITYTITARPGVTVSVGFTSPGISLHEPDGSIRLPYRDVVIPASGRWSTTVPAGGWTGGQNVPILAANVASPIYYNSVPGMSCSITQDGSQLARDNEPREYFCLTSTSAAYRR